MDRRNSDNQCLGQRQPPGFYGETVSFFCLLKLLTRNGVSVFGVGTMTKGVLVTLRVTRIIVTLQSPRTLWLGLGVRIKVHLPTAERTFEIHYYHNYTPIYITPLVCQAVAMISFVVLTTR
jgi:hypothetical protein